MTIITSENYWSVVFSELQSEIERNGHVKYLYISKKYDQAIKVVEDRIRAWYGKYALQNKVSLRQAYRKLPKDQLDQFHSMIEEYIRYWHTELGYDQDEINGQKVSEKDTSDDASESDITESFSDTDSWIETLILYQEKKDVTRYEALVIPIVQEIEKASHETSLALLALIGLTGWGVYKSVTDQFSIRRMSKSKLTKELIKSWAADDLDLYSRFNSNKAKLSSSVKTALVKGFRSEMSVDDVVNEVSKFMGIGQNAAKRLVLTENAYFNSRATYEGLKQAGYTHYRYICRLLPTSCDTCIELHNTVFPLEAYDVGVTASPMHPNCLCYIIGEDK